MEQDVINIYLGKNTPRIRFQSLQLPKDNGGMALPCLEDCYKAAQLCFLVSWVDVKWKELEQKLISVPLPSILGDNTLQKKLLDKSANWIVTPLNIWHKKLKDPKFERKWEKMSGLTICEERGQ